MQNRDLDVSKERNLTRFSIRAPKATLHYVYSLSVLREYYYFNLFLFCHSSLFLTLRTLKPVLQAKQACLVWFLVRKVRAGIGNQTVILISLVASIYIGCSFKAKFDFNKL